MRAGLQALLELFDEEPELGALCVVDVLGTGPATLERRAEIVRRLVAVVDEGRHETRAGASPTRLMAEGVVGAVLSVLHARLARVQPRGAAASRDGAGGESMVSLLGPLMAMIVLPYQGHAAATREAERPAPRRRAPVRHGGADPLRGLDMRLTYRTVRVLRAVAENAGASNRQIGEASDIADQGQISKLLVRLERHGLIRNDGAGRFTGEPNVWSLTPRGEEVERTIRQ